jgi:deazaflavin-dependent oxidoreductase (nitroreductase family)
VGAVNASADFCYLTTTGRVSGKPHEIEIWFASDDGTTLYLLSGGGERADWVRNIQADGSVHVRVDDEEWDGDARVVTDDGERRAAAQLVFDKYQPRYSGDLASWRERSLPVAIRLGP